MTQKERIEMLAKLYWNYTIDLDKVEEEGHELAMGIDNNELGASLAELKLLDEKRKHIRNKFVNPVINLLHAEGVKLMKMEGGKLKLLMKDNSEMLVDIDE